MSKTNTDIENKKCLTNNITTKEYLSLRIDSLERLVEEKFFSQEKAFELRNKENEIHFSNLNHSEQRKDDELRSIQTNYLPRELYESKHNEIVFKIEALQKIVYIGVGIAIVIEIILKLF